MCTTVAVGERLDRRGSGKLGAMASSYYDCVSASGSASASASVPASGLASASCAHAAHAQSQSQRSSNKWKHVLISVLSLPVAYPDVEGGLWHFESGGGGLILRKAVCIQPRPQLVACFACGATGRHDPGRRRGLIALIWIRT